jgi:BirA family transcriptional regulator, biotin operon repressor / biotin---[acetyl-CoA-carboxylase] ligase
MTPATPPISGEVPPSKEMTSTSPYVNGARNIDASYSLDRLRSGLRPFRLHWFPTLGSTNTHAIRMRREGRLVAPAIVLTGRQTAGRGRGSNVWRSPPGVMTVTFAVSQHDTLPPQHVPLIVGLIVRDVATAFGALDVRIKWPNDLWIGHRKLGGLLCERLDRIDLIGVGLNVELDPAVLPGALAKRATSLAVATGKTIDRTEVLLALAKRVHETFGDARTSLAAALPELRRHDALTGRTVCVTSATDTIVGQAIRIDSDGRLIIRRSDGTNAAVVAGSVAVMD